MAAAQVQQGCTFCEIVAGGRAASVVYRDEDVVAFLDRRPLILGHTLVVPTGHVATLGEMPVELIVPLMRVVQATSRAMESALEAQGSFVAVNNHVSQSVPHVHVHVVPRNRGDGLRGFFWPRHTYESDAQRDAFAQRVSAGVLAELARS